MKKYFLFFLISFTFFLTHAIYTKHALYGDGNGYYATSLSLLTERTLKSDRVIEYLQNFPGREYVFSRVFWDVNKNPYSVGTSIAWLPALELASLLSSNPFDLLHEIAPGITGIMLMLAGLWFLEKHLLRFFSARSVNYTIVTLFLGSSVFYYTALEPALSHQVAFFIISFLLYWTHNFKYSWSNLLTLGILFGFLNSTRIVDTILLIPLFFSLKIDIKKILIITVGMLIGVMPQIAAQQFYYGSVTRNFYLTESVSQWSIDPRRIFSYLFSYKRGLFTWSPIYLVGVYGLLKMQKRLILFSVSVLWVVGSFWSGYMSAGFGQRLSFAAIPYFAIGLAYVYEQLSVRKQAIMAVLAITWNIFLLYGFYVLKWKNLS